MAESKKPLMMQRGAEYLELVRTAPHDHPAEVKALAEFVGVSRRLFYKPDPEIQQLVSELEDLRERRVPALSETPEDAAIEAVPETELAIQIDRATERVVWAMKKFVGQRARGRASEEASLVAYDLDVCMGQLRAAQQDLRPLVAELSRRSVGKWPPDGGHVLPSGQLDWVGDES